MVSQNNGGELEGVLLTPREGGSPISECHRMIPVAGAQVKQTLGTVGHCYRSSDIGAKWHTLRVRAISLKAS